MILTQNEGEQETISEIDLISHPAGLQGHEVLEPDSERCLQYSAQKLVRTCWFVRPQGLEKNNVAMLCIMQAVQPHCEGGRIKKDQFKILCVAPMKALAAEMSAGFSKRLKPLGLTVPELTGDMSLTKSEISQTQMLVTTPKKWDMVTKKPGDTQLAMLVRLLILEEVHLLQED